MVRECRFIAFIICYNNCIYACGFHACFHFAAVVVNRDGRMEDTVERIEAIIHAEKSKVSRNLESSS